MNVSWTVQNNGTDPANGPWQDYVYLSTKNTFDSSATLLKNYYYINGWTSPSLPLAPGATYTQTVTVSPSAWWNDVSLSAGNYYLFVVADADQGQSETTTAGNVSAAIPLAVALPELVVTQASANVSTAPLNSAVTVDWTVANQGSAAAGASWYDEVFLSANSTYDSSAKYLGDVWVNNSSNPLAAGANYNESLSVNIPNVAPGSYYLLVYANESGGETVRQASAEVEAVPIELTAPACSWRSRPQRSRQSWSTSAAR